MLHQVPRTCTFFPDANHPESHEIAFFRESEAYVLLGDPGAGKTTLFRQEADDSTGLYISARDFLTFNRVDEWRGRTLFIDALDETRAGVEDARTPLDAIRGKLDQLGRPRFRLSCREADWLGGNDQTALNACTTSGKVIVLHLNALTDEDIGVILAQDERVFDVEDFMQKAKQYSLEGLLYNPQTLDMLIAAVQGSNWPNTKLDTYELACRKMAVEHSDEHKAGRNKQSASTESLLDAAGFLSAVQLLANASAFNEGSAEREGQVCLSAIKIPDDLPCDQALQTRLFKCANCEYQPVHRSVAEFLGGRFLAKKIKEGLPLRRILALMTGCDGGVVAALRGLASWLGAHSLEARSHLIGIDPLGVVLYGDVQLFSTQTKRQLLNALRQEAEKSGYLRFDKYWASYPFAALTTRDMASQLLELLNSPSREKHDQLILNCILDGLYRSECIPELKEALLSIVRDGTYWNGVRLGALQAFVHQYPEDVETLLALARDFRADKIEDNNGGLLSFLLTELFPKTIGVAEILNYLKPAKVSGHRTFNNFWDYWLTKRIQDDDLPVFLDEIVKCDIDALRQSQVSDWFRLVGELLTRGLDIFGETITDDRLYDWLSLGLDEYEHPHLNVENHDQVRAWLESHPERFLNLLGAGLTRATDPENLHLKIRNVFARLYSATPPDNLGLWWLERALVVDDWMKSECFDQAWWTLINGRGSEGLSLEFFENWVEEHPEFNQVSQILRMCELDDWRREHVQTEKMWVKEREAEKAARIAYFREHLFAIQDGSAHPQVLHDLAAAYFDHYSGVNGKNGAERLDEFLDHDNMLISAAQSGLSKVLERTDLPSTAEIFELAEKQREHYIRLPFLTCMAELYRENPAMLATLSDELAEKALAFWYTYGAGNEPGWVKPLSTLRPELAARVFIEYVSAMLAAKESFIYGSYQLAHDPEYCEIARLAALPLLECYPVRANKQQASTLEYLLKAAAAYADKAAFLALISKRLGLKSLDVAQRVYWLAAGLVAAPEQYSAVLKKYVSGNVARINHLSAFLYSGFHAQQTGIPLSPGTIGLIVELLAPRCKPHWPNNGGGWVTPAMNEGEYVNSLLKRLGENPDIESARVIEHLLTLPKLSAWRDVLKTVLQTQQIHRREALFRHPGAGEVALTLNNLKPANVADLAALATDFLNKLSGELRAGNTDSYKRFWNEDGYARPVSPKTENSCRDYLVERLKPLLSPLDVEVQPETHEANDKRADMRLSCRSNANAFHLPVEIKLGHSPDLWRAIHQQLIPRYTLDPETQGRGIFLVIYFGDQKMFAPPSGKKPKTAEELAARLIEGLTLDEKKLIDVLVLDAARR